MRHGVRNWFLLSALLIGMFAMGTAQAATPYMDPNGKYSFMIPDGYTQQMSPMTPPGVSVAIFSTANLPGARFTITATDDPLNAMTDVDSLTGPTLQELVQAFPDIEVWTQGIVNTKMGSADAREYVFRGTDPNSMTKARGALIVALRGTTTYTMVFLSQDGDFDKMADQCTPVLATFAFAGEQPNAAGAGAIPTGPTATPKNIIAPGAAPAGSGD